MNAETQRAQSSLRPQLKGIWRLTITGYPSITRSCLTKCGRSKDRRQQPAERAKEYSPGRQPWVTGPPIAKPRRGDGRCFRARFFHRPRWGLALLRGLAQGSLRFALGFIPPPPPEASPRQYTVTEGIPKTLSRKQEKTPLQCKEVMGGKTMDCCVGRMVHTRSRRSVVQSGCNLLRGNAPRAPW